MKLLKKKEFEPELKKCNNFLRHKSHILDLGYLASQNIQIFHHTQLPGDIVVTSSYHQGGNGGLNVNVAINVAIESEMWTYKRIQEADLTACDKDCTYDEKSLDLCDLDNERLLTCEEPKCRNLQLSFFSDMGKRKHDKLEHDGPKEAKCIFCNEDFNWVIKHIKKNHKSQLNKKMCKLCRKLCDNVFDYLDHWTQKVKKGENYCLSCEKRFKYSYEAQRHHCVK